MTKPLYMEILSNERSQKVNPAFSAMTFSDLNEAAVVVKKIARDNRVKIFVRGRKGNLRFMADGRR